MHICMYITTSILLSTESIYRTSLSTQGSSVSPFYSHRNFPPLSLFKLICCNSHFYNFIIPRMLPKWNYAVLPSDIGFFFFSLKIILQRVIQIIFIYHLFLFFFFYWAGFHGIDLVSFPPVEGHLDFWFQESVQSLSCVRLFVIPLTEAHQVSLSITNSQSLLKLMSIELVMPSNISSSLRKYLCTDSVGASVFISLRYRSRIVVIWQLHIFKL